MTTKTKNVMSAIASIGIDGMLTCLIDYAGEQLALHQRSADTELSTFWENAISVLKKAQQGIREA